MQLLLVDDHELIRDGLRALIESESGYEIVGVAKDGREAIQLVDELRPDVTLIDLAMPGMSGIEAIRKIKSKFSDLKVVALTYHDEDQFVHAALGAGADGYVLKNDSKEDLFGSIRTVAGGNQYLSPSICNKVIQGYLGKDQQEDTASWSNLTRRELEVIKLVAEGRKTKDIAEYMSVSVKTVEKHRSNLMRKLDLHNSAGLTAYAIKNGLLQD